MSFSWYDSNIPAGVKSATGKKREAMLVREIAQRARLLRRLGRGQKEIERRVAENLAWEFEPNQVPKAVAKQLKKVVKGAMIR